MIVFWEVSAKSNTSSWPTSRPTPRGWIGSSVNSRRCVTSRSTAPITDRMREQNSMIRCYIAWRNRHRDNAELRDISMRANVAW